MASDAHCHPFDLAKRQPLSAQELSRNNISIAASSWKMDEFISNQKLKNDNDIALCFGVHPQLCAKADSSLKIDNAPTRTDDLSLSVQKSFDTLVKLCDANEIDAIGEIGFDLFDKTYRKTEAEQEVIFALQLELAVKNNYPVVLHVRRAMHKIFFWTKQLRHLPAVVFHNYQGTSGEAESIVKRGINAYFSFGTALLLNHKKAINTFCKLDASRLLLETDAPYQPLRGKDFSTYTDIFEVLNEAAKLRQHELTRTELEAITDNNFRKVFFAV